MNAISQNFQTSSLITQVVMQLPIFIMSEKVTKPCALICTTVQIKNYKYIGLFSASHDKLIFSVKKQIYQSPTVSRQNSKTNLSSVFFFVFTLIELKPSGPPTDLKLDIESSQQQPL